MTEQLKPPKRLIGRIDTCSARGRGEEIGGYLVTEDWSSYSWNSRNVEGKLPDLYSIVSFEVAPPSSEGMRPRAIHIRLEKENASPEYFGRLARFVRERSEEVA